MGKQSVIIHSTTVMLTVLGILLLLFAGVNLAYMLFDLISTSQVMPEAMRTVFGMLHILFWGLFVLGVSQYLAMVAGLREGFGWILRNGEYLIYTAILVILFDMFWGLKATGSLSCLGGICGMGVNTPASVAAIVIQAMFLLTKLVVMVGIAQALRILTHSSAKSHD